MLPRLGSLKYGFLSVDNLAVQRKKQQEPWIVSYIENISINFVSYQQQKISQSSHGGSEVITYYSFVTIRTWEFTCHNLLINTQKIEILIIIGYGDKRLSPRTNFTNNF